MRFADAEACQIGAVADAAQAKLEADYPQLFSNGAVNPISLIGEEMTF